MACKPEVRRHGLPAAGMLHPSHLSPSPHRFCSVPKQLRWAASCSELCRFVCTASKLPMEQQIIWITGWRQQTRPLWELTYPLGFGDAITELHTARRVGVHIESRGNHNSRTEFKKFALFFDLWKWELHSWSVTHFRDPEAFVIFCSVCEGLKRFSNILKMILLL